MTTIVSVRKGNSVVVAGDGQVSLGQTVMKHSAKKVRRLAGGTVIAGFAGATADAFTLSERLEAKLEQYPNQLMRACVELAKDWRTDRYLRRLEAMMIVLTEGSEQMRQAVTETLAAIPDEGHPVLYDAIHHDEMMVRRAATFGLRRAATRWGMDALYRAFLEDDQWYVRSAAQQAFYDLQQQEDRGPRSYPALDSIPWLSEWAGARGENVPAGPGAIQVLLNALQEGDPEVRVMAARVLGQLGEVTSARTMYAALRDRQEEVRAAAYHTLADFETQLGEPLPAPA